MDAKRRARLLLSIPEAAEMLDISQSKLYEILPELPVVQIGRNILIPRDGLEGWRKRQQDSP